MIAYFMKEQTSVSNVWLAKRLNMGVPQGVSRSLGLFTKNNGPKQRQYKNMLIIMACPDALSNSRKSNPLSFRDVLMPRIQPGQCTVILPWRLKPRLNACPSIIKQIDMEVIAGYFQTVQKTKSDPDDKWTLNMIYGIWDFLRGTNLYANNHSTV